MLSWEFAALWQCVLDRLVPFALAFAYVLVLVKLGNVKGYVI